MLIIRVVQEHDGWSIRNGEGVKTPFRSKQMAISRADMLAGALRRHGAAARVIVDNQAGVAGAGLTHAAGRPPKLAKPLSDGDQPGFPSGVAFR